MATATVTNPKEIYLMSDDICIIGRSEPSTPEEVKRFAYDVSIDGVSIGDPDNPFIGIGSVPINLKDLIACRLTTKCPTPGSSTVGSDDSAKIEVEFKYGDACYPTDCESDDPSVELSQSETFQVLASNNQFYQTSPNGGNIIMADNSGFIELCRDADDFIYTCGSPSILFEGFYSNGLQFLQTLAGGGGVSIIPTGPANGPLPDTFLGGELQCYRVSSQNADQPFEYVVKIVECCCDKNERIDILFQQPKGTWSVMTFDCVQSTTINRNFEEICRAGFCATSFEENVEKHSRQALNKRSWKMIELTKEVNVDECNECYYEAFANAGGYKSLINCSDNQNVYAPIIGSTSTQIRHDEDSKGIITFTGFYANDLSTFR